MIILIHGQDIVASRKTLAELKEKNKDREIVTLNGKNLGRTEFLSSFDAPSLFSAQKLLIIERFFVGIISKEKQAIITYLSLNQNMGTDVIFWEEKEMDKNTIKKLGSRLKEMKYQPPTILFKFLDLLGTVSSVELLVQFHILLSQSDVGLIYSLLLRHIRYLLIAKDMGLRGFSPMPSWQSSKYIRQAQSFSIDQLVRLYRKLLHIDYQIKSGQTPLSLSELLDLFFVSM